MGCWLQCRPEYRWALAVFCLMIFATPGSSGKPEKRASVAGPATQQDGQELLGDCFLMVEADFMRCSAYTGQTQARHSALRPSAHLVLV